MSIELSLPPGDFDAYLFDCDGTIADTMPLHYKGWQHVLTPRGCPFDLELFYSWGGIPTATIVEMLNDKFRLKMPVDEVLEEKENFFLAALSGVQPIRSVVLHIEKQHGKIPFAVVSGGPGETVRKTLATLNLLDRFETIVAAEDYSRGKPHPEPFLTAALRLGVAPEKCLVFEDAELGIQSAKAAGMAYVRV